MQKTDREVLTVILVGGIIAASIDIAAASIISSRSPAYILQVIAGGLVGKVSFSGGMGTMTLGAILQEAMGVLIATIYVVASKFVPALRRHWILSGLAYGVAIFFVMNFVVLPLSAWKVTPHFTSIKFTENMAAMLLFGLIVAFFRRRIRIPAEPTPGEAATT
jgi:uncharacterized membrane protein YagU involved in acid resistance